MLGSISPGGLPLGVGAFSHPSGSTAEGATHSVRNSQARFTEVALFPLGYSVSQSPKVLRSCGLLHCLPAGLPSCGLHIWKLCPSCNAVILGEITWPGIHKLRLKCGLSRNIWKHCLGNVVCVVCVRVCVCVCMRMHVHVRTHLCFIRIIIVTTPPTPSPPYALSSFSIRPIPRVPLG